MNVGAIVVNRERSSSHCKGLHLLLFQYYNMFIFILVSKVSRILEIRSEIEVRVYITFILVPRYKCEILVGTCCII